MAVVNFSNVEIIGIKLVIPPDYIDIDDELIYFDNDPKKLARQKKIIGYGRRYLVDKNTTVLDLACDAAEKLLAEMSINRSEIDLLIFVNQKPDYGEPTDAAIAHGRLDLLRNCTTLNLNLGCSGYVHGLMVAHSLLSSGAYKKCLLLAGDLNFPHDSQSNRKSVQIFGDSGSATILKHSHESGNSIFITGSDGKDWDKIIKPFGGTRLPFLEDSFKIVSRDKDGNIWNARHGLMKGEYVFNFSLDVGSKLISDVLEAAHWKREDVDLYAIHQANRQIVKNIIDLAGIPPELAPSDVFTKYANTSTNSVVTVICDQPAEKKLNKVVLCTFGIGLSWGGAAIEMPNLHNGGISFYSPPAGKPDREEQIAHWVAYFAGG